ncbi:MAG: patatin-like phospholipase family protein [Pseudomonadota bacterium]
MLAQLRLLLALILASILPAAFAVACDDNDQDGLDVAVVFSGGGALAATQVGALTVIEDIGVPIHCVVGTSMGAFVSGLYASGYDAREIEDLFVNTQWGSVFRAEVPRNETSFIHKEREGQYLSDYVFGIGPDGVRLPQAIGTLRGVKALLREKLSHLPSTVRLDALRVPFRAVATNLSTGEPETFERGDLAEIILASMAVPAAFPARVINGEVYVDGGMSAQLPVDVAKAMGADIIIALDTTVEPQRFTGPVSIVESTQQLIQISVWQNWQRQVALLDETQDVLIRPDITGLNPAAFERSADGIGRGREEARKYEDALKKIMELAAPARDKALSRTPVTLLTERIILDNDSAVDDDIIRSRVGLEGKDLRDSRDVRRRLNDLAAFGGFGTVDLGSQDGIPVLTTRERGLGRNLLQLGLQASSAFNGDSTYAFLGRLSRRPFGARGGELSLSAEFGTDIAASLELYQPFGADGRFFVRPELYYAAERILFDIDSERLGEFRQESGGGRLRFGRELGTWGVVGIDGILEFGRFDDRVTIIPDFEVEQYQLGGIGAFAGLDTLDRLDWPRSGFRVALAGQRLWDFDEAESATDKYNFTAVKPFSWDGWGLLVSARFESVRNDDNDPVDVLRLGGFRRLSAFAEETLPTNQFALGSLEVFRRLTSAEGITNFPVYIGLTGEVAEVEFDIFQSGVDATLFSVGGYLGGLTPVGPIFLGGGIGNEGDAAIFFSLGQSF